jgi:hypothetical protein
VIEKALAPLQQKPIVEDSSPRIQASDQQIETVKPIEEPPVNIDLFKQSIGSNLLLLMQKEQKQARRFNFKVDFEEIDRIMEEEESAPIVAPAKRTNVPQPKRKAWNDN